MKKIKLIKTTFIQREQKLVNGFMKNVETEERRSQIPEEEVIDKINELITATNLLIDNTFK